MKPQIFVLLTLLLGCGTDPAADVPSESDAGTDSSDTTPDTSADAETDAHPDSAEDVDPDAVADTKDTAGPDVEPDTAERDVEPDIQPDAEELVTQRGWYSHADEHSGFIPEGDINNASFDAGCNAYLVPLDDGEQWWTVADEPAGLALHPATHEIGFERMGLIEATGIVRSDGPTGHWGEYERDFALFETTLLACETVERMPRCLTPRTEEICFGGLDVEGLTVRHVLVEVVPRALGNIQSFQLRITTGENVGDGRTDIILHFGLELSDAIPEDDRYGYTVGQIEVTHTIFEFHAFPYQEIPFELRKADGWITLDRSDASIELSLDLAHEDGSNFYLWGDFPITDTLIMP
ncbi:MAG: hypothetical protein ACJAYU_001196 [Bradymonadia bacterium]|jgi:hypothetical protein